MGGIEYEKRRRGGKEARNGVMGKIEFFEKSQLGENQVKKHRPVVKRKRQDLTKPTQTLITMYGKRKGVEGLEEEEERERKCRKFSEFSEFRKFRNFGNGQTLEDQSSSPRKGGGERIVEIEMESKEAKATFGAKPIPCMISGSDRKKGGEISKIGDGKKCVRGITTTIKRIISENQDEKKLEQEERSHNNEIGEGGTKWKFGKGFLSK